ncbi:MAG: response regulator [Pseudomonadota bacterium]
MSIHSYPPILLVEDSPEDFHAAMRAFQKAGLANPIIRCEDGDEALEYLFCRGRFAPPADAPLPGIILLDLNLPGTDGHEVLEAVKKNGRLKKIPVIVLTTSCEKIDIDRCFSEGASSYICKPVDLGGLMNAVQGLKEYWFEIAVFSKE